MADKLTIGRCIHYRVAGGPCYPATVIRPIKDRDGFYSIQVNKGFMVDGVIVRKHDLHEELAWHWPQECPQGI